MSAARIIARLAAPQYGLVTRAQLLDAGIAARTIDRCIEASWLVRLHESVYAAPGSTPSWRRSVLAACLSAGPSAAASHVTAGILHGLVDRRVLPRPEVTVPIACHPIDDGFVVHRTRRPLEACQVASIPTTSAARTLADLARVLPASELEEALETAVRRQLVSPSDMRDELRFAIKGRRLLSELISHAVPSDSVMETKFRRALRDDGLPAPVAQYEVRRGGHLVARVDFAYPEQRIAIELDGDRYHNGRVATQRGRLRQNELQQAGYAILRFGWQEVIRPSGAMGAVRRLLFERGHPEVVSV